MQTMTQALTAADKQRIEAKATRAIKRRFGDGLSHTAFWNGIVLTLRDDETGSWIKAHELTHYDGKRRKLFVISAYDNA